DFDVKLTDEERIDYFKGRQKRDVIRPPGQEAKADDKAKPYRDKVLEKAVEYIKGELGKQAQNPPGVNPPQTQRSSMLERRDAAPAINDIRIAVPTRRENQAVRGS